MLLPLSYFTMSLQTLRFTSIFRIHLLGAILAMLSVAGALGAATVPRGKLVGEWEDRTEPIQQFRLSLRSDGTYRLTVRDLGGPKSDQGQWWLDGDTLVLLMTESERCDESGRPETRYQVGTVSEKTMKVRALEGRSAF